jgi:hypothetical protein
MASTGKHAKTTKTRTDTRKILKGIEPNQVRKFRFHTLMILLASIVSVSSTFTQVAIYLHILAIIPTIPAIVQEAWDMFKGF